MAFDKAKEYLKKYGLDGRVQEFDVSSATVELASVAVGCEPAMIAKTLSFDINGAPLLILAAGDAKVDNPKFKAQFGCKARMLAAEDVERLIGHGVGGVCPFGINDGIEVCLDESLWRFEVVYPACGSSNSAVKLTCEELENCLPGCKWVDVCKNWQ